MIVLFGFLFVTVSSRITGVIGSSSNPISGMTIATLLLTCLIFVLLGWVGPEYRLTALSIAGVVCIASSNGGTTSQDLKTGFLVGATPWKQQVSILVGALISAVFMGLTLLLMNQAYTTVSSDPADLPTVKAPAAEIKGTEIGPDGKSYQRLVGHQPAAGRAAGQVPGRRIGAGPTPDRLRHRRAADQDGVGNADPEVQSAAAPAVRHVDRRDHDPEAALGTGHPGRGAGDRDATGRRVGAGVCRRRLPAAGDHVADLRRRRAPRLRRSRARGSRPRRPRRAPAP